MNGSFKRIILLLLVVAATAGFKTHYPAALFSANPGLELKASFGEKNQVLALKDAASMMLDKKGLPTDYILDPKYFSPKKRDPFVPLSASAWEKSKKPRRKFKRLGIAGSSDLARQMPRFRNFGNEIKTLKTIPLELYREIGERVDRKLHADLERYSRLFREKTDLKKMTMEDYYSEVNFYKRLIDKANRMGPKIKKTALQAKLQSLKLVGIVWGEPNAMALIETADNKGYTAYAGTLIGANFGVIELIEPEKVVIVERRRDFRGNISSKTRKLEFVRETRTVKGKP